MRSISNFVRLAIACFVVTALVLACGSGDVTSAFTPGLGDDGGDAGGPPPGFQVGAAEGGVATNTNCKPLTCADQKIECGPAGDGCGGLIPDCGKCDAGKRCGGPGALSKCVSPSVGTGCVPKTCTEVGVECGLAGDGCGGTLTCGSCQPGQQCGVTGTPSKCVSATPTGPDGGACVLKTCADYKLLSMDCGPQSDGCGGTLDCGKCVDPEFCGGGGPSKCAVSGGGVCVPKTCADYPGSCGPQSNGCGGVTSDCGGCVAPAICGGGGTPSVCGGGILPGPGGGACVPRTVCAATECGKVADGCGGVLDCGTASCTGGFICGGAGVANQCGAPTCKKIVACPPGLNCGSIGDGCGGTVSCGAACVAPAICGGAGVANQCGGGTVVGPGGGACVPLAVCPANACGPIADGCGGVLACGGCISPAVCGGGGVASRCGGGNQCTPKTQAAACGTENCGYAPDGCGGAYTCGVANTPACPAGESCGLFAPNQCGSLSGPCITTGAATQCVNDTQCCSGFCSTTGVCTVAQCKNDGLACPGGNADCCSGKCTGGFCASINGGVCKALGSSCAASTECCSQACVGGTCSSASFCYQNNESCLNNGQCCSGSCVGAVGSVPGTCKDITGIGGGISCGVAGTVVTCSSSTTYVCNAGCCSGACGPNDSAAGFEICQQPSVCGAQGELCTKDTDCCQGTGAEKGTPLICSKTVAGAQFGRCNGATSCSKPGEICKTATDACQFPNNCCEPSDLPSGGCNNDPGACCSHDNLGIPRCRQFGICRSAGQTCGTAADCCPIGGVIPPCTVNGAGVKVCAATTCVADLASCTADADCCGGNCYKQTAGAIVGQCKIPTCTPKTCAAYPGKCGQLSDGCGGIALAADGVTANCGGCTLPQTCGGAGVPNVCGGTLCTATTCAALGADCGTVPDGCGNILTCPNCPAGTSCGGGGVANKCGAPTCAALTCAAQGIECGQTGDGCGNLLTCPTCPPGTTCGGGGVANKCGAPTCTPLLKCPAGKDCGDYPDGCGGAIHCGDCAVGQTCGGGGAANVCGMATCTAKSCAQQGAQCGTISDQCGGVLTCSPCGPNQFCNGLNQCVGLTCTPKTCAQLSVQCGPTADGCGGLDDCGNCPAGTGCGAGGVPGQCGMQACLPLTCSQLGAVCGQVADGCGGLTASCGTCAGALSCKNGACVTACTPTTCAAVGAQCGTIADGCGGSIDCGMCTNGETCGFNNLANKCGKDMPK